MANLTGYGLDGPQRMAPAYDAAIQAVSGGMSITGHVGGAPARAGIPIADLAGGVFLALGVLAALRKVDRTGEGVMLDLSLLDTQISLLMYWAGLALNTGIDPPPQGSGNVNVCPYGAFPTADGHVIIAIFSGSFWPKLCAALDRPDLTADPRYVDNAHRLEHRAVLEADLEAEFRRRTTAEWLGILEEHDVPSGPVNSISQAMAEPQVIARDMRRSITIDGQTLEFPGNPIKTSPDATRAAGFAPPPRLGQHSQEILSERLGLDTTALSALASAGVINSP
jgi:crotonobetainyl-CoA:carnitine CoA-transferase CaiB-like acyl-CoA transferase